MLIEKSFSIDCAHCLELPYESKCQNLHGHTYKVTLVLEGEPNGRTGIVVDYTKFPKELIMQMDHKFLVAERHTSEDNSGSVGILIDQVALTLPERSVYIIPGISNTTAEELSRYIYGLVKSSGFTGLLAVRVKETEATEATYNE